MLKRKIILSFCLVAALLAIGCSSSTPLSAPLANFSPEIVNNVDAFSFQITNGENITTTVEYSWENTGTQATINHSTTTTSGTATMIIYDADSAQVYTSGLVASANEPTTVGTAGTWIIRVTFTGYSGTSNFRVDKL